MRTGMSWLDVRLGARMLVKHPGLTLVGGLGMAVAIAIGACFYALVDSYVLPTVPLDEGERLVGIENWDVAASDQEPRSIHDFATWREELESVEDLGAFATIRRTLVAPEGPGEPVHVAEMTASGFRAARVPPLLGRHLVEDDERAGAPPVVVIGHTVWRARFHSDPHVVGRSLRLGSTVHTIVGVMPEGFAFPMNFRFWTPLKADPSAYERRQGPEIFVFGRLAPGATLRDAQAELTAIGGRTAAAFPETHAQIRPRVVPFTAAFSVISAGPSRWQVYLLLALVSMLLVVVSVNVAILVYARTATRLGEIAVRSALGAGRRRIVAQLFVEALVLSTGAAALGILLAGLAMGRVESMLAAWGAQMGGLPFWIEFGLSSGTVLYAAGLAVVGAVIAGVVPAVQATGRRMQSSLRQLGGGTGMQLGRTWTALIVSQAAFAVAVLPAAVYSATEFVRSGYADPGFAAEEFLTARLEMDRETPPSAEAEAYEREFAARYGDRLAELVRRLEAEPGVADVTFASSLPGLEPGARIEVAGEPAAGAASALEVQSGRVDPGFFEAFRLPVLTGRGFRPGDHGAAAEAVVVNRTFVQRHLGGGNALGRRVRYTGEPRAETGAGEPGPWYEIVGVVEDQPGGAVDPEAAAARMYHPLAPGQAVEVSLAIRVRGGPPASFAARLREVTTGLDPMLRPHEVLALDEVYRQGEQQLMRMGALALALVTVSVLLLSAAGIYALMSFTVAQRRREIGIRAALGAHPRRILASIFSRAAGQLAVGIATGVLGAVLLAPSFTGREMGALPGSIPAVAATMLVVGLLAALGPARRGLRIQPSEALRSDV